jgi:hypothetical protein
MMGWETSLTLFHYLRKAHHPGSERPPNGRELSTG